MPPAVKATQMGAGCEPVWACQALEISNSVSSLDLKVTIMSPISLDWNCPELQLQVFQVWHMVAGSRLFYSLKQEIL